jgi:hypothetical protein
MKAVKMQIVSIFVCAAFSTFIAPQLWAQQDAPPEVIKAAETGVSFFLDRTVADKSAKVRFGFKENDSQDQARLGKPFQLHFLNSEAVINRSETDNVNSFLIPTGQWYFPVMIDKEVRTILTVASKKGYWKAVAFGQHILAKEVGKLMQTWPKEKGYTPLMAVSYQAKEFLFTVPQRGANNLTIMALQGEKDGGKGKDYSRLEDSANVIKKLRSTIKSAVVQKGNK